MVGTFRFKSTLCVTLPNSVRPSALREFVPMTSMDASLLASTRAREGEESSTVRPVTCKAGYSKARRPTTATWFASARVGARPTPKSMPWLPQSSA